MATARLESCVLLEPISVRRLTGAVAGTAVSVRVISKLNVALDASTLLIAMVHSGSLQDACTIWRTVAWNAASVTLPPGSAIVTEADKTALVEM